MSGASPSIEAAAATEAVPGDHCGELSEAGRSGRHAFAGAGEHVLEHDPRDEEPWPIWITGVRRVPCPPDA